MEFCFSIPRGCKAEFKEKDVTYDLRQNSVLAEEFHAVGAARFGIIKTDQEGGIGGSSTGKEAHEATLVMTKTLAHVGMKVLQDEGFLEKVSFESQD